MKGNPPAGRPHVAFAMRDGLLPMLFGEEGLRAVSAVATLAGDGPIPDLADQALAHLLAPVDVLITGWGCQPLDRRALAALPRLRFVLHAAGSVKHHVTPAVWARGIQVSTAADANAVPVAEYALAMILLSSKGVHRMAARYRTERSAVDWAAAYPDVGTYRRTVGIVGASRVGRRVIRLLRPHDLEVVLSDPTIVPDDASALGARLVELDELLRISDVVSLHAPELPQTRHLLDERRLALMPDGATLVNTARGSLVDQDALVRELAGGRLNAVLDVTEPEVLPPDSPLHDLPNVLITPHVAGSLGRELRRLGDTVLDELRRIAHGEPLAHPVVAADLEGSA